MKNPPRALLAKLFKPRTGAAFGTSGIRHLGITPTLQTPDVPANHTGGINQGHIDSGEAPVVIPVYYGIETGQDVVLYFNDNPVYTGTVIDETQALLTYVPARELPSGDSTNTVHYHAFTGFGGTNEESSYPTSVRVKTTVPGNPPGDPSVPGVNPTLAAPVDVPPSIPDPAAVTTVPVGVPAYANMAEGDVITVFWGGAGVVAPALTAAQVGRVVYVEVPQSIIAARPGNNIVVRYHVYDAVRNYSLYSQNVLCNVTPVAKLPAPLIVAAPTGTLDMDRLAGSDVEIMVLKGAIDPAADITLHFTGQPDSWPYLDYVLGPIKMGAAPFHTFTVPNVLGRSLVNSEVFVFYEAVTGGTIERSTNAQAQVVGTAFDLPALQAPDAPGGLLDPDKITGATFDLIARANTAFIHDTQVQLVWEGFNGAGDTFDHELTTTIAASAVSQAVTFKVQKGWAEEIAGGSLELHYNLIVPGAVPVTYFSERLLLNVAGEATLLPLPQFEPALTANDELDVDTLSGPFNVKVNVTNAAFVGGTLRVHWEGQAADQILESPVSATGVIRVPVDRTSLIDPNLDQSVDVWYEIVRADGRIGRSGHVLVSVISAASQAWPVPEIWDYTGANVNPYNPVKTGTNDTNTATVVLRDARLKVGDVLAVIWRVEGRDLPFAWADATNGEARAPVPDSVIAASLGKTVEVTNVILLGGTSGVATPTLSLRVLDLPADSLSELIIVEAANGGAGPEFDVSTQSAATIRVGTWPLIATGQPVWLTLEGTNADNSAYVKHIWQGGGNSVNPTWISQGYYTAVVTPFAELQGLKDGSDLRITLKAGLAGSDSAEAEAVVFAPRTYTVKSVADTRPVISNVTDSNGTVVADGGTTYDTSVTITGNASPNQRVEIFDNSSVSKGIASVDGNGGWARVITGLSNGRHSVSAKALYGTQQTSLSRAFTKSERPITEDFYDVNPSDNFATLARPAMTIRRVRGKLAAYQSYNHSGYPYITSGWVGIAGPSSNEASFELRSVARSVRFGCEWFRCQATITYYNSSGSEIGRVNLRNTSNSLYQWVDSPSSAQAISRFTVSNSGSSGATTYPVTYIDNILLTS